MVTVPPGAQWGPAQQTDYEFVWIMQGRLRWRHPSAEYTLDPRSVLLIRPDTTDVYISHVQRRTRYGYVHLRPVDGLDHVSLPAEESWPALRVVQDGDPIRSLLQYVLRLRDDNPDERWTAGQALQLALELFLRGQRLEPDHELPPILQKIAQYVHDTWADGHLRPVPVAELATVAATSRGHLSRLFRAQFGLGPFAALELVRLSHAATLLNRSNLTINQVATTCGFADSHHLSRRFRGAYGLPPGRYRTDPVASSPMTPLYDTGLEQLAEQTL